MDTTETIILTSIVNIIITGLVGGLIVYRIQKKIDISYQKQMEEFRASLQLSNFEEQTKFVKLYEKRAETLETLYKKQITITDASNEVINKTWSLLRSKEMVEVDYYIEKFENLAGEMVDFSIYLETNRLFLPDNVSNEIEDIYRKTSLTQNIVSGLILSAHKTRSTKPKSFYKIIEMIGLEADNPVYRKPLTLLHEMTRELRKQKRRMEKLYKSVADTSDNTSKKEAL